MSHFQILHAMQRSRDWCFTINNPTGWDDAEIDKLYQEANYVCYGIETGESFTKHYQGFVMFSNPRTISGVKRILTRAHLEGRKGTVKQAINYCKKDGDFHEWGDPPVDKKTTKERWKWVIERAEQGDIAAVKDEEPAIYLRYLSTLRGLKRRGHDVMDGELEHEWWWGKTGSGKSRYLHQEYPDHYQKPLNKWWDGYEDEETVGIEEVHPGCGGWLSHFLKIWADRYPFTAEIKGGTLKHVRPAKIIVTSNYTIEECFPEKKDFEPLRRRFKVKEFINL